jgi:hypothetical protein
MRSGKMYRNHRYDALLALSLLPALFLILGTGTRASAQQFRRLMDLRGEWRFEIGDDLRWADPSMKDAGWATLRVPGQWEEQGFPGYDGYAWYRKTINIPADWAQKQLYLDLGAIDDVDETYVNGQFIGFRGQFPPDYVTAYNESRSYCLPSQCLRPGEPNVIAVRVYDSQMGGGIVRGEPAIKELAHALAVDQPLPMTWKFEIGDNMAWSSPQFNDGDWERIRVPGFWETQGHKGYNGFAWYRVRFKLDPAISGQHLILFLGKIDDIDEAYLNGERIGKTGTKYSYGGGEYRMWRAYTIPNDRIFSDRENVLAVRVFDGVALGGIYEGPIGIVRREKYLEWKPYIERTNNGKTGVQRFLQWLFE